MSIIKSDIMPGALLMSMGVIAMVLSNSPLSDLYFKTIHLKTPVNILFVVNEVLMTIFFLDVGLEIKKQVITGHLSKPRQVFLPVAMALGGVILPAIIFILVNRNNSVALRGWAIPTATDIAFALGVIILLGKRIPISLRVLLLTIAIVDDLIAVLIIALFYTDSIIPFPFILSLLLILVLIIMNHRGITNIIHYLMVGALLWFSMLHSGIHATLAGFILALVIPMRAREDIHKHLFLWVSYFILPLFALTNAGISLQGVEPRQLLQPVPLGIAVGLVVGKQLGVISFGWIAVKSKLAVLPSSINWGHIYGMGMLCGIGFTMSIFIGNLAYSNADGSYLVLNKVGVLAGSIISALLGYSFLQVVTNKKS